MCTKGRKLPLVAPCKEICTIQTQHVTTGTVHESPNAPHSTINQSRQRQRYRGDVAGLPQKDVSITDSKSRARCAFALMAAAEKDYSKDGCCPLKCLHICYI